MSDLQPSTAERTRPRSEADTLVKPDMQAVLTRTYVSADPHGFLLPVLEAVSNSMHSIEARFGSESSMKGRIEIAFQNPCDPAKLVISITDNGVGLTDANYNSFKTPFSGYKLEKKGRGFGRFIAFKVFGRILYSSRYDGLKKRTFRFDITKDREIIYFDGEPDFPHEGMRVEYNIPLPEWADLIKQTDQAAIADAIASHFLPYFLYKWLPEITIQIDNGQAHNITRHFKSVFVESDQGKVDVEIDGTQESLYYSLAKIPRTRSFKSHCLLFSAGDRVVGSPKDLTNMLGAPYFKNEKDENYIVIGAVRGEAFERRLNDSRTGVNIAPKEVEKIVAAVSEVISKGERHQIDKIKDGQSAELNDALHQNPILRLGLKGQTVGEYVKSKPNNWSAQQFVADLAIERFRASKDLTKAITLASSNAENYAETIKDIVKSIDQNNKEALAEYVVHRKNVIELVETARKYKDDGKHAAEDVIHDLIFKRFTDNSQLDYLEHNLWLIDDALAFLPYVSSDRTTHGGSRQKGDKVTDLALFDDSLILGEEDGTTVTIVEFKKPSRNDYSFGPAKSDPVTQVIATLEKTVRAGGVTRSDGTHMSFTGVIRRFGYIIADLTPTLVEVLRLHDFKNDQNPKIFFKYRDNERVFIQALGYDTLLQNAKKRNQVFFSVLLGE